MFGEFGLYVDDKVVAFVCDDQLYLKPTPEGERYLGQVTLATFYPGSKDYFLLASELDEPERLRGVLEVTASALPEPKPKRFKLKPKKRRRASD
jgi:TfoX/Sxy family transcriptional regulator of competence genes